MILKSLDDKKLSAILIDYINNDKTNQAVLIDGEWGSGKTFFIQEVFMKEYETKRSNADRCKSVNFKIETISDSQGRLYSKAENNFKVNTNINRNIYYVSLYGLGDVSQIEWAIYEKLIVTYMPDQQSNCAVNLLKVLGKVMPSIIQYFGIAVSFSSLIKEIIGAMKPIRDMAIVFDDLERCNIELNSILGYINNLVEHCNVKAIIIANEKEIWRAGFSVNIAEKYNTALNHLSLLNEIPTRTDVKAIHDHAEKLFSQDNGYEKVKEKLVGIHICYTKCLKDSYDSVLSKFVDDQETKDILKQQKDFVLAQFNSLANSNIRMLINFSVSSQRIIKIVRSVKVLHTDFWVQEKSRMLNYLIYCTIKVKSGEQLDEWNDESISRHLLYTDKNKQNKYIYGYKFIHDFVIHGYVDETKTVQELQNYYMSRDSIIEYNEFINRSAWKALVNWRLLEDVEVYNYLTQLKNELAEDRYQPTEFGQIILVLAQLEEKGFSIAYEDYIQLIRKKIEGETLDNITVANFSAYRGDSNVVRRYREVMNPILEMIEMDRRQKKLETYTYLNTCQWDEDYVRQCQNIKESFLEDKQFLALFDLNKFAKRLHSATAKEVHFLLYAIREVYCFNNINEWFKADVEKLDRMIAITEQFVSKTNKLTIKANLGELLDAMKNYLERLKK